MKKVYIAHPLRGAEREKNVAEITKICKKIVELFPEVLPISPIHAFAFLDNCGAEGEKKALELCLDLLKSCDEVWFFGDWNESEGCRLEYGTACTEGDIPIYDYSSLAVIGRDRIGYPQETAAQRLMKWLLEEVYAEAEPPRPCPFCGGTPDTENATRNYGHVACRRVSCLVKPRITWGKYNPCHTRAEAIAAWNRRAGE